MMWQTIEVSAIIVECFLAIYFNVNYFKMKDNKYVFFKIFVGTLILSLWDYFGTLIVKSEFLSMGGFALLLLVFSSLYLNNTFFEKIIMAVISCTLFYLINLPILYVFSFIFNQSVQYMTSAEGIERIITTIYCASYF